MYLKGTPIAVSIALTMSLTAGTVFAQRNYTDGGDLYGGARSANPKAQHNDTKPAGSSSRSGKFDPYTEGTRGAKQQESARKLPDERPQPDDVARKDTSQGTSQRP